MNIEYSQRKLHFNRNGKKIVNQLIVKSIKQNLDNKFGLVPTFEVSFLRDQGGQAKKGDSNPTLIGAGLNLGRAEKALILFNILLAWH